jgi:hypothetical protein
VCRNAVVKSAVTSDTGFARTSQGCSLRGAAPGRLSLPSTTLLPASTRFRRQRMLALGLQAKLAAVRSLDSYDLPMLGVPLNFPPFPASNALGDIDSRVAVRFRRILDLSSRKPFAVKLGEQFAFCGANGEALLYSNIESVALAPRLALHSSMRRRQLHSTSRASSFGGNLA